MVDKTLITKGKIIQILISAVALLVCVYAAFIRCKMNCQDHWLYWEESSLVAFVIFNISLYLSGWGKKSWSSVFNTPGAALAVTVPIFLVSGFLIVLAFQYLTNRELVGHLCAILGIALAFLLLDFIIYFLAKKKIQGEGGSENYLLAIRDAFKSSTLYVDIPTTVAFLVLLLSYLTIEPIYIQSKQIPIEYYEYLIGGAIAFQLLASIIIFLFILCGAMFQTETAETKLRQ